MRGTLKKEKKKKKAVRVEEIPNAYMKNKKD